MRLVEVRLLDGPNVYLLEPAVKLELVIGRRRTWFGQRMPDRYAIVRQGAAVPARDLPPPVRRMAGWVRRLHRLGAGRPVRALAAHRTSEPGHWVLSFAWQERELAEEIAHAAYRLTDRGADPQRGSLPAGVGARLRAAAQRGAEPGAAPEWITDAERHVPLISISGTNGKSTTTRMIGHILQAAGRRVAMTTTDGVYLDGELVEEGDLTGPLGARTALGQPGAEVGVFETARGGILLRGLGYQSNDAAVLTNVSADHLDLQGLHTLPELAEVKSVIARVTRPRGTVVLNADDALVAAVARRVRAPVTFFGLRRGNPRVRRHLARGGRAMLLDDGWLVEAVGARRRRIVAAADVPATLGGLARHNIANALAAAGGARALGASIAQVADGLRTFRPTADQLPGRLNLYRRGHRLVIVDYAHNEAGLEAVFDLVEALVGRRGQRRGSVSAIIGTAGDRPDDALRALGRIAGARADQVALKITRRFLRGRPFESQVGVMTAGVRDSAGRNAQAPVFDLEPEALAFELTDESRLASRTDGEPRVVLLTSQDDRPGVARTLVELEFAPVTDVTDLADLRAGGG